MSTVSILIATYNRPKDLASCLAAIAQQECDSDIEVCIVNDGGASIQSIVNRFKSLSIQFCDLPRNVGQVAARNRALEMASGEYVALCDDDDRFLPGHIDSLVKAMTQKSQSSLVYTDVELVKIRRSTRTTQFGVQERLPFAWRDSKSMLRQYNPIAPASVLYPRAVHRDIGVFDVSVGHYWDWDFWLRLGQIGEFIRVPECQTLYGLYDDQSNQSANPAQMRPDLLRLIEKHHMGELPSSNFERMLYDPATETFKTDTLIVWDGKVDIWLS